MFNKTAINFNYYFWTPYPFVVIIIFLKKYCNLKKLFLLSLWVNAISTALLVIIFNFVLFNFIKGQEEGYFDDPLPMLNNKK